MDFTLCRAGHSRNPTHGASSDNVAWYTHGGARFRGLKMKLTIERTSKIGTIQNALLDLEE